VGSFPDDLAQCTGFQWDAGNSEKNWDLHRVARAEAEEIFFNRPIVVAPDLGDSYQEPRFAAMGRTNGGRCLVVIFAMRGTLVRVISARDANRRERRVYEQASAKG
jgi:uncharacterized DUF497 family protein